MNESPAVAKPPFRIGKLINLNELIFDIALTVIGVMVYRMVVPKTGFLTSGMDFWTLFIIVLGVQFIVVVFFGSIYRQFEEIAEGHGFVRVLINIILFVAITGVYVLMPLELFRIFEHMENAPTDFSFVVFGLMGYMIILGALAGFRLDQIESLKYILYVPGMVTIATLPIAIIYFFINHGVLAGILTIVILAGILIGVFFLKKRLENKDPSENKTVIRLKSVLYMAVIPILTVVALTIWQELTLISTARSMANNDLAISAENILPILLWSGFIPVRILAALAPPYKPVNTVITLGSFYFYYISLVSVIDKIAAVMTK
ncbi:MAG: hypothetical protein HPY53_16735 [Brevinematales bacterium]|nr:hypothetical protein [Brevinematales bacterium]